MITIIAVYTWSYNVKNYDAPSTIGSKGIMLGLPKSSQPIIFKPGARRPVAAGARISRLRLWQLYWNMQAI